MHLDLDPYQHTIKEAVSCCGTGLATTLGDRDMRIATTEHLMAALRGYGIDNADIDLDAGEVPIMDGSAEPFLELMKKSGRRRQNSPRRALRITRPITYCDGEKIITASPCNGFRRTGEIAFDDEVIRHQRYQFTLNGERFEKEIARARTFGYVEQVEELWANGLALGGTLENVIAIHWNRTSVLNEDGLRFEDEFIRHKVLELIGDLALLGCPVMGHITALKTGHTQHLAFMQLLAGSPDCWEIVAMNKNGAYSVLDQVASPSQNTGSTILPLSHRETAVQPT